MAIGSDGWIGFTSAERAEAMRLAEARMSEPGRRLSPDRPTSRNIGAQLRGALGELGAVGWLRGLGFPVECGFESDDVRRTDVTVGGVRIEIMTAQIAHRAITGFCVPPNKLQAARSRRAWGYLFLGTGPENPCERVCVQAAIELARVDMTPPRLTSVSARSTPVLNHVMRTEDLLSAPEFLVRLRQAVADHSGG